MSDDFSPERLSTDELFRRYADFVARLVYRLGVPAPEIDDVVQEVFVVVHRLGGYVRGPATPTSYLGSIAYRAAASSRRRDGVSRRRDAGRMPDELGDAERSPVEMLERGERLLQLEAALARLDPKLRMILVLVDLEGESCVAVAASERIPVGTVYWRLHRARRKFREALSELGDVEQLDRAVVQGRVT